MIRAASRHDIPALKVLFKACFGDTDEFLDLFFSEYFQRTTGMVAIRDKRIVAMLFLCPAKIKTSGIKSTIYYVYACATLSEYRNQGIMNQLLQVGYAYARQQKAWGLILVPASSGLAEYYSRLGFIPFSHARVVREKTSHQEEGVLPISCTLTPKQIHQIRNERFGKNMQVQWSLSHIDFSVRLLTLEHGGSLGLQWANGDLDYALYQISRKTLSIQETSVSPDKKPLLSAFLFRHFSISSINYFTSDPAGKLFSMVKPTEFYLPEYPGDPYFNLEMA